MSALGRALGPVFRPQSMPWFFSGRTYSGKKVSVDRALNLVPVYNAVSQIAGGVACLPLPVYKRAGDYRERVPDSPAWRLLHDEPNPDMAADEWGEITSSHIELWGNSFQYEVKDSQGRTIQLWPLAPDRVQVARDEKGRKLFYIEGEVFRDDTIVHIRGLSKDGLLGYSPVQLARHSIANAIAQEEFQGRFLKGDGKPAVLLRHPNELKPDAAKRLKASWDSIKSGDTAVLEENIEVERWTMPLEDAQFIEQMEFSDKRVAQMFLLPPGRLGAKSGDSLQYSTTESEALQFVTSTLQRRLRRIESVLNRRQGIFPDRREFCEYLIDALLRANLKERYQAYLIGKKAGFLTNEDIRPKENLPSIDEPPDPPPKGDL
jgi:HK97 family phage portal protein